METLGGPRGGTQLRAVVEQLAERGDADWQSALRQAARLVTPGWEQDHTARREMALQLAALLLYAQGPKGRDDDAAARSYIGRFVPPWDEDWLSGRATRPAADRILAKITDRVASTPLNDLLVHLTTPGDPTPFGPNPSEMLFDHVDFGPPIYRTVDWLTGSGLFEGSGRRFVLAQLAVWQYEAGAGPVRWQQAWERATDAVRPLARAMRMSDHGGDAEEWADGAAALAMVLYILAAERDVEPDVLTRADVETALSRTGCPMRGWDTRLVVLGHDLSSGTDPVAMRWRALAHEYPEPKHIEHASEYRVGTAGGTGIRTLLAPYLREKLHL